MKFSNILTHDKFLRKKIGAKTENDFRDARNSTDADNFWTHTFAALDAHHGESFGTRWLLEKQ